jgi:hypothetical protein
MASHHLHRRCHDRRAAHGRFESLVATSRRRGRDYFERDHRDPPIMVAARGVRVVAVACSRPASAAGVARPLVKVKTAC